MYSEQNIYRYTNYTVHKTDTKRLPDHVKTRRIKVEKNYCLTVPAFLHYGLWLPTGNHNDSF